MPARAFVDIVALRDGGSSLSQSCLVPPRAAVVDYPSMMRLGERYLRFLDDLPLVDLLSDGGSFSIVLRAAPRVLHLLRFAPPYLVAARGGCELRYPILGGLLARASGGHLAVGVAAEGEAARLWVDVVAYSPRLGLNILYLLTQVQLHRVIAFAFLRRVATEAGW